MRASSTWPTSASSIAAGTTQYSASYPNPAALRAAVAPDAALVVTDENRDRARNWGSVLDNLGYTEQAGEKPLVADPNDARLPLFPNEQADAQTTTQQRGVKSVQASSYGNTISYTPEDRAERAFDGDPSTAWRAAALGDAIGQYMRIQLDGPITTDHVNLVQPLNGGRDRWITSVQLIFDGRTKVSVGLDASSRTAAGQTISFGPRALLDARDQDHRRERPAAQALRGRRRCRLRRDPPARCARQPRRAHRRGRADAAGSPRRARRRPRRRTRSCW